MSKSYNFIRCSFQCSGNISIALMAFSVEEDIGVILAKYVAMTVSFIILSRFMNIFRPELERVYLVRGAVMGLVLSTLVIGRLLFYALDNNLELIGMLFRCILVVLIAVVNLVLLLLCPKINYSGNTGKDQSGNLVR